MTLTHIFHSGFALETEQSFLVFDYWMDPSGVMDSVLRSEKPLYVFSSHFHEDHFTKEIFEWKKLREDITDILSKDIYKHRRASKEDADVWLAKGGTWSDDTLGARQFIERFKVGLFVPMHFTTGFEPSEQREQSRTCSNYAESRERKSGAQSSWRMKEFTDEKNIPFWEITREGETIKI